MTDHNHALNKTLAHLIRGNTLAVPDAVELVHQVREEGRAMAWDSAEARQVAADAQSWQYLRARLLELVDDPNVWDDGASEAEVLAGWVRRVAATAAVAVAPAVLVELDPQTELPVAAVVLEDTGTTQPMVTLDAARRPCGGGSGRVHLPHTYSLSGVEHFCPGRASIPQQHGPDTSEQDRAS